MDHKVNSKTIHCRKMTSFALAEESGFIFPVNKHCFLTFVGTFSLQYICVVIVRVPSRGMHAHRQELDFL